MGQFSGILRAYNQYTTSSKYITQYERAGVSLVPFLSRSYPKMLTTIIGKPLLLYVKGNKEILKLKMVAIVGSRRVRKIKYGRVREIVKELINDNYVIVSGLAIGCDSLAHKAALELGGKTIGVLAHGLDMVYPKENQKWAEEIINKGGAIVSELPFTVVPEPKYFLERNRIIVGMSQFLIVLEAGEKSGSMASATLAAEMGREVFAVKGSPGCDLLVSEGAKQI
jgi:DNA processing protein